MYMLWFNFILGLNFIFFCFKLIIIHYHTQKQRKIKFKPRIKLNHNIYIGGFHAISGDTNNNGEVDKCWWTNKAELMSDFLFTVHQHGGDDAT